LRGDDVMVAFPENSSISLVSIKMDWENNVLSKMYSHLSPQMIEGRASGQAFGGRKQA